MEYQFSNFIGGSYSGGDIQLRKNSLFTILSNYITIIDLEKSKCCVLPCTNASLLEKLSVNASGTLLLAVDSTGNGYLFNLNSRKCITHVQFGGPVKDAAFSMCGDFISVALEHVVQIWRVPLSGKYANGSLQLLRKISGFGAAVRSIAWSPCSRRILVSIEGPSCRIYTVEGKSGSELFIGNELLVVAFWGAAECLLYTLSRHGLLLEWEEVRSVNSDWNTSKNFAFNKHGKLQSASFTLNGKLLAIGFEAGFLVMFDVQLFEQKKIINVSNFSLNMCKLGDHSDWITLADDKSGRLLVWDWVDEVCICRRGGHEVSVSSSTFSSDSSIIVTGSHDNKVRVWNTCSGECVKMFDYHSMPVTAVCFMYSDKVILSASKDGTVRAYDLFRSRNFRVLATNEKCQLGNLAVDSISDMVCAGSLDTFNIYMWSIRSGRILEIFAGHEAPISTICLSGGSLLISGSWDKTVRLWDIFKGKQTEMLEHTSDILSIATRFDSEQIAVATGDGHIVLWNKRNAEIVGTLENTTEELKYRRGEVQDKENAFQSIIYNSDGTLIYAAGIGLCIIIFDVVSRSVIRRLGLQYNHIILRGQAETQIVKSLSLSPDGSTLSVSTPMGVATYQKVMKTIFPSFENSFYEENVNTKSVLIAIEARNYTAALLMILRVKTDVNFTMAIINCIPISQVREVVHAVPDKLKERLLKIILSRFVEDGSHIQYLLYWLHFLLARNHEDLSEVTQSESIHTILATKRDQVSICVESNNSTLAYLSEVAKD